MQPRHAHARPLLLSRDLIVANAIVAIMGVLSLIFIAMGGAMGLGMLYADQGGFRDNLPGFVKFILMCFAILGFPLICLLAVAGSLCLGCDGKRQTMAMAIALVPPLICLVIVCLIILAEEAPG